MDYYHRTYGPAPSDTFSSNVLHSILSSPTDTLQALNEALDNAKIQNNTQSIKIMKLTVRFAEELLINIL